MATTASPLQTPQPGRFAAHAHPTNPVVAVPVTDYVHRLIYSPHAPVIYSVTPKGRTRPVDILGDRVQVTLQGTMAEVTITGRLINSQGQPGKAWRSGVIAAAHLDPAVRTWLRGVIAERAAILIASLA